MDSSIIVEGGCVGLEVLTCVIFSWQPSQVQYKQTKISIVPSVRQIPAMPIAEIEEIFNKYKKDESKIEHLLTLKQDDISPPPEPSNKSPTTIPIVHVITRNKQILKDLEIAKANLRSKAIFSPSEMQWERIYHNYYQCPSMPVTTYKCHMPAFV